MSPRPHSNGKPPHPSLPTPLTTVLVVDEYPMIRDGVAARLSVQDWCGPVLHATDGQQALAIIRDGAAHLAVMDVKLPGLSGFEVLDALRGEDANETRIVIYSAISHGFAIARAIELGAAGYVSKSSDSPVLIDACRAVLDDGMYVDPSLAHQLVGQSGCNLSARELEVLELMSDGMRNEMIANELGIGQETVKTLVSRIMNKLNAESRTQAVATAFRMSLVE